MVLKKVNALESTQARSDSRFNFDWRMDFITWYTMEPVMRLHYNRVAPIQWTYSAKCCFYGRPVFSSVTRNQDLASGPVGFS